MFCSTFHQEKNFILLQYRPRSSCAASGSAGPDDKVIANFLDALMVLMMSPMMFSMMFVVSAVPTVRIMALSLMKGFIDSCGDDDVRCHATCVSIPFVCSIRRPIS
jgi:hypothetical protein